MLNGILERDSPLNVAIESVSDAMWTYVLLAALVACGVYFTVRLRGVQFTMIGEMFRLLRDSGNKPSEKDEEETVNGQRSTVNRQRST